MTDRFAAIPADRRKLVTNHHVLGYLAERFGFTVVGAVVPSGSTLAAPSSSDLESLASAIRATGVHAIFVDSSQPDKLARVLADDAGVDVDVVALYTESLDEPGSRGATYLDMMRANTDAIVTGDSREPSWRSIGTMFKIVRRDIGRADVRARTRRVRQRQRAHSRQPDVNGRPIVVTYDGGLSGPRR